MAGLTLLAFFTVLSRDPTNCVLDIARELLPKRFLQLRHIEKEGETEA